MTLSDVSSVLFFSRCRRRASTNATPKSVNTTTSPSSATGRRRHTSSGQSQVRSLYDGLSHLYTDCDSRLRHVPNTNYADRQRRGHKVNSLRQMVVSCVV